MSLFGDVEEFVSASKRVTTKAELGVLLSDMVRRLGFDHVALVHHVNLAGPIRDAVQYVDYPEAWAVASARSGYFARDPVLAACESSATAFAWSDLPKLIDLDDKQREILEAAGRCGMGEGFTVPVNVPGDLLGSCSFATRFGRELPKPMLPAAQYVGCFAFEAARRLRRSEAAQAARPRLTQRQFDCLVLAAQGKSDWHIAQLLGISKDTVHQHLEAAKRRYGVASRTQLVVRALFDSQIAFSDVIPRSPSPD